jgi:hypothetical protein
MELSKDRDLAMAAVPTSSAVRGSPHQHASMEKKRLIACCDGTNLVAVES